MIANAFNIVLFKKDLAGVINAPTFANGVR